LGELPGKPRTAKQEERSYLGIRERVPIKGMMDIEVGIPVEGAAHGDGRVKAARLPAGRYASLVYSGSGIAGNRALLQWIEAKGFRLDRWDDPRGDAFRSRYESYLTDLRAEPRRTRWNVRVSMKLIDP
jgi:hypothetical protein